MSATLPAHQAHGEPPSELPDAQAHDETSVSISVVTTGINHTSQEHLAPDQEPFTATPIIPNSSHSIEEGSNLSSPSPPAVAAPAESAIPPVNNRAAILPESSAEDLTPPPPPLEMKSPSSPHPITPSKPSLSITLLLISGVRHQFTINEPYLESHSVPAGAGKDSLKDPFEMSVWQLKECIWKDWRDEWEQRPASALFIRLIHFGRMLDDKQHLKDCRLNQDSPNVVHMTIRPAETGDDEMTQRSAKVGFGSRQRDDQRSPSCRCVIL